jgi:adenylosuccinate lyase
MIPRYSRPEMAAIWDPQTRFRIWFDSQSRSNSPHLQFACPRRVAKTPI